jgi:lipoprotein-anchoring transpeptidase ErfK/SrfK
MELHRTTPGRNSGRVRHSRVKTPVALGVLLLAFASGCGHEVPEAPAAPRSQAPLARAEIGQLAEATTFGDLPAAPADPAPATATAGVVANVKQDQAVYDAPDGRAFARLPAVQLHNPTWVPVIAERGEWIQVLLPSRPNRSTGWLRLGDPAKVTRARTPYIVDVDVDARRLTVSENGREVGAWTVGVGSADTPTPRGRTFIMASIEETVTRFSPIILPLGVHSETLNTYGGGPGTVALHGWPDSRVFGRASSDGCVRVPEAALRLLTSLPLGTLVLLR